MISETAITETAKLAINTLIQNLITPKIDDFIKGCKIKYKELMIPRGEHFEEYLYRSYKKHSIVNTLVFKNEQRLIKDLYVPLTLVKTDYGGCKKETIKVDKYPSALLDKYRKILIVDTAGMGKSTLSKRLFLDVIDNANGIPMYIELRRLSNDKSIIQELREQLNSLTKDFDMDLFYQLIQTGGFIFFLDGFDEISLSERANVTADLQSFIAKASNNSFIMTSRPEQALASFGDFQAFYIAPLTKKESYELLRKYDSQGITSKKLISELKTDQYDMIDEFLKNPLLVSLLYAAFDYKQIIPLKKNIFYRQVYDAYFDSHDLSKGDCYIHEKKSKLDIDNFEQILRYVGFNCLKSQKIEFEKEKLLQIIEEAKGFFHDLNFSSSDFLSDVLKAVPLFCKDGQYYKWVHKSLQEYFAAQFIFKDSKDTQDEILTKILKSNNLDNYINLLDLYYDIDSWGFKKNILLPICEKYKNFYDDNIFQSNIINNEDIEDRIGLLFLCESYAVDENCLTKKFEDFKIIEEFNSIVERTNGKYHGTSVLTCNDKINLIFGVYYNPIMKILPILEKRFNDLFKPYKIIDNEFNSRLLNNREKIKISVNSFEYDNDAYRYTNHLLCRALTGNRQPSIINILVCSNVIKSINETIVKKRSTSNLTDGL